MKMTQANPFLLPLSVAGSAAGYYSSSLLWLAGWLACAFACRGVQQPLTTAVVVGDDDDKHD
jgi:hypothetical protein